MSNSGNVIPTSIDRRKEIIKLLDEIENYMGLTIDREDQREITKMVQRIKELF